MIEQRFLLVVCYTILIFLVICPYYTDSFYTQSYLIRNSLNFHNRLDNQSDQLMKSSLPRIIATDVSQATSLHSTSKEDVYSSDSTAELSLKDKFKKLWKAYGIVLISTYLTIYVSTLASLFLALDLDWFNAASVGLDPIYAIQKV